MPLQLEGITTEKQYDLHATRVAIRFTNKQQPSFLTHEVAQILEVACEHFQVYLRLRAGYNLELRFKAVYESKDDGIEATIVAEIQRLVGAIWVPWSILSTRLVFVLTYTLVGDKL